MQIDHLFLFFIVGSNSKIVTTKTIGCKCLEWQAKRLDIILQLNGSIPIPILCYICELAGLGESYEETKIGRDWINNQYERIKEEVEENSGENSRMGSTEGWYAKDGGLMSFSLGSHYY